MFFLETTRAPAAQVVLYNWMSLPNKNTMLEELEVMVQAADKVTTENNQGQRDFGHLIILVRDVGGPERAEEVKRLVLDNEEAGPGRTRLAQRRAQDERNTIRDGLREGFASITVHAMPRPHPQCGGEYSFQIPQVLLVGNTSKNGLFWQHRL